MPVVGRNVDPLKDALHLRARSHVLHENLRLLDVLEDVVAPRLVEGLNTPHVSEHERLAGLAEHLDGRVSLCVPINRPLRVSAGIDHSA